MPTVYFLKNGRIPIHNKQAQKINFDLCSDARGILALDEEEGAETIAALKEYVAKRIGGVSVIDEATYEDLKKNHPYDPSKRYGQKNSPRLFSMDAVVPQSISAEESARRAEARANAVPVAGRSPAPSAVAQAPSANAPVSRGRRIRTARVSSDGEVLPTPAPAPISDPSPVTSEPAAAGEPVETPATTDQA